MVVQSRLHAGDDVLGWNFGRNGREIQSASENTRLFFGKLMARQVGKPATWKWCLQHLLKDSSNRDEEPGVVYRLTCNDCDQTYIGETGRTAIARAKEHVSYVRNGRFDMSAAADHAIIHQHSLSFKTVQIIDHEPRAARRRVKEALHIRTEKNPMNKDKGLELDPIWFSVV